MILEKMLDENVRIYQQAFSRQRNESDFQSFNIRVDKFRHYAVLTPLLKNSLSF